MSEKQLVTHPLTREGAAQAYPLVRELNGAGTLDEWLRFVERHLDRGQDGGVIVCERGGYIRGLFGWEVRLGVGDRRELLVRHFTVPGVLEPRAVVDALLDAVELLAERLHCAEIALELPMAASSHPAFAARGLVPGSIGLHRRLSRAQQRERPSDA